MLACLHMSPYLHPYSVEVRPISGYEIQKKGKRGDWTKANIKPVDGTTYTVTGLPEGAEMEFRVAAVNDAGPGKPSKSTGKHIVRDPVCECATLNRCFTSVGSLVAILHLSLTMVQSL